MPRVSNTPLAVSEFDRQIVAAQEKLPLEKVDAAVVRRALGGRVATDPNAVWRQLFPIPLPQEANVRLSEAQLNTIARTALFATKPAAPQSEAARNEERMTAQSLAMDLLQESRKGGAKVPESGLWQEELTRLRDEHRSVVGRFGAIFGAGKQTRPAIRPSDSPRRPWYALAEAERYATAHPFDARPIGPGKVYVDIDRWGIDLLNALEDDGREKSAATTERHRDLGTFQAILDVIPLRAAAAGYDILCGIQALAYHDPDTVRPVLVQLLNGGGRPAQAALVALTHLALERNDAKSRLVLADPVSQGEVTKLVANLWTDSGQHWTTGGNAWAAQRLMTYDLSMYQAERGDYEKQLQYAASFTDRCVETEKGHLAALRRATQRAENPLFSAFVSAGEDYGLIRPGLLDESFKDRMTIQDALWNELSRSSQVGPQSATSDVRAFLESKLGNVPSPLFCEVVAKYGEASPIHDGDASKGLGARGGLLSDKAMALWMKYSAAVAADLSLASGAGLRAFVVTEWGAPTDQTWGSTRAGFRKNNVDDGPYTLRDFLQDWNVPFLSTR